ncbi:citrulline utilization hydrolase CtlX [Vogesella sp. GCM10023246]|uniref:Arginine deiminase-related protein n=1 Tax=Vogesella oryzagri TaxID=3160864 RepID=A0ABV1M123_9NEIS
MQQTTRNIVMVRPVNFFSNPETSESNRFQKPEQQPDCAQSAARGEFDGYVAALRAAGVQVLVIEDQQPGDTPDSIFPNNWISMHADGRVFLYPMEAPNRRRERRDSTLARLRQDFYIESVTDLSGFEAQRQFLEGTGSIVFDHQARVAYVCLSSRSHPAVLDALLPQLGYRALPFDAVDRHGAAIYHTNVMMAVGRRLAVVCLQSIRDPQQRDRLRASLQLAGREIIDIDYQQMESFCGNVIELADAAGGAVFAMSSRAWHSFTPAQQARLLACGQVAHAPLDTIEDLGGGGARCMVAENFLPPKR